MSAATVLLAKERRVLQKFREAGAVTPTAGRSVDELRGIDGRAMRRLRRRDVIRESTDGVFYLDEERLAALRNQRRRLAAMFIAIACAVVMVAFFLLER